MTRKTDQRIEKLEKAVLELGTATTMLALVLLTRRAISTDEADGMRGLVASSLQHLTERPHIDEASDAIHVFNGLDALIERRRAE